jgi:hypothetical protein
MDDTRSYKLILLTVVLISIAGCAQFTGQSETSTASGYHENARTYLLTGDEIGGEWSVNQTREGNLEPIGMESSQAIDLENSNDELTVAVAVFESPTDASSFINDRRNTYESDGYAVNNESLGDEAISTTTGQWTYVDVRAENVVVEVYGDIALSTAKRIGNDQLGKIRN